MRIIYILSAVLVMASSCRRYETCATYADAKQVKSTVETAASEKKANI